MKQQYTEEELLAKVDEWHADPNITVPLHKHLGMDAYDYSQWVMGRELNSGHRCNICGVQLPLDEGLMKNGSISMQADFTQFGETTRHHTWKISLLCSLCYPTALEKINALYEEIVNEKV